MVLLVPYDGSPVSERALERAVSHGQALGEDVVGVTLIPTGSEYAERRVWIEPNDDFAADAARNELERKITETTDDIERVYDESGATTMQDGAASNIKRVAREVDASAVYVGTSKEHSEDRLTTPFGTIEPEGPYDVYLVRAQ